MTGPSVEKKPNRKAALREESIQRLTHAAFRLIVAKGYHACTLHEIAQTAGLTKGAIFFYFDSKENLLLRLLDIAEAEIVDTLVEHLGSLHRPAPDRIAAYFRFTSQQGIDRPYELLCLVKLSIEGHNSTERAGRRISEIYQRIYAVVEDIVADGKRKGELDPQLPTREFATMVVATHDGMMLEWYRRGGGIDGRVFVRTVWQTFLSGILPREAESRGTAG